MINKDEGSPLYDVWNVKENPSLEESIQMGKEIKEHFLSLFKRDPITQNLPEIIHHMLAETFSPAIAFKTVCCIERSVVGKDPAHFGDVPPSVYLFKEGDPTIKEMGEMAETFFFSKEGRRLLPFFLAEAVRYGDNDGWVPTGIMIVSEAQYLQIDVPCNNKEEVAKVMNNLDKVIENNTANTKESIVLSYESKDEKTGELTNVLLTYLFWENKLLVHEKPFLDKPIFDTPTLNVPEKIAELRQLLEIAKSHLKKTKQTKAPTTIVCMGCNNVIPFAHTNPKQDPIMPGKISICPSCIGIGEFTENLDFRVFAPDEWEKIKNFRPRLGIDVEELQLKMKTKKENKQI